MKRTLDIIIGCLLVALALFAAAIFAGLVAAAWMRS